MRTVLTIAILLFALAGFAQQKKLTGTILSKAGNAPLSGVTVATRSKSVLTDENGKFSLDVSPGETITISYVGMKTVSMPVSDPAQPLNIQLDREQNDLDQVIVTGYKTEKKKDITGAVSIVNINETTKESNVDVLTSLQGRVPGVVINNDGTPGGTNNTVIIRGFSTTGSTGPLYVIDGVATTNIAALNPRDVESMQVLKDAASASIYGARANNGVIIVTTKRGKSNQAEVTLNAFTGVQSIEHRLHYLNTAQYGQALWSSYAYSGLPPSSSVYGNGPTPVTAAFIDPGHTTPTGNTDWIGEMFHPAAIQSYTLGLNKASDKSSFYLGASYDKSDGIQRYSGYDKFSTRFNSSYYITPHITVGENLQVAYFRQVNFGPSAMNDAAFQFPFIPVHDNAGNFSGPWAGDQSDKRNPIGELYNSRDNRSQNWRIFGNVFAEADLVKGLTFKTSMGVDYTNFFLRNFSPSYVEGAHGNPTAYLTTSENHALQYTWTNTLNYHLDIGRHGFDLLGGMEAIKYRLESMAGTNNGFIANSYDYAYLGSATGIATATGAASENALLSQFAKFNYSYAGRYLFSATARRDGSSRFGLGNQYGVFPAFSAGWRISQENFLSNITAITDLKLRGSWGQTGNQEIGDYNTQDFFKTNPDFSNYNLVGTNTGGQSGYYASSLGNPNLKWEAQTQTDIGLDFLGFGQHVTFSADWYNKQTSNLLINPPLLAVAGSAAAPYVNSGKVQNKGIELAIGYNNGNQSKFHWGADFNIAFNRNKILALTDGVPYITTDYGRIQPGHAMNEFFGYINDGIFRDAKDVTDYTSKVTGGDFQAAPGRLRYKDLNGDGTIDDNDRTFIGNPNPKFNYGLNLNASWKGFDASVFFSGVYGNKIFNEDRKYDELNLFLSNFSTRVLDAWTPQNTNAKIPALQETLTNDEGRTSTYFVESGSYLKIKSIQIGYTLPKKILANAGIHNIRFYFQGENLFTFTKYTGMDPESVGTGPFTKGVDYQAMLYPHAKSINFGLNLNF